MVIKAHNSNEIRRTRSNKHSLKMRFTLNLRVLNKSYGAEIVDISRFNYQLQHNILSDLTHRFTFQSAQSRKLKRRLLQVLKNHLFISREPRHDPDIRRGTHKLCLVTQVWPYWAEHPRSAADANPEKQWVIGNEVSYTSWTFFGASKKENWFSHTRRM